MLSKSSRETAPGSQIQDVGSAWPVHRPVEVVPDLTSFICLTLPPTNPHAEVSPSLALLRVASIKTTNTPQARKEGVRRKLSQKEVITGDVAELNF